MQLARCPVCHARIGLDAVVQDEAGRELLGLLVKLDIEAGAALVGYISLFRSASRDLSNAKALLLAEGALALGDLPQVVVAMRKTAEALQGKGGKPLSNHNYLKQVIDDMTVGGLPMAAAPAVMKGAAKSKTAQTMMALEAMKNG